MMKFLLTICLLLATCSSTWAGERPSATPAVPDAIHGKVLQTLDAGAYTYLHLKAASGDVWAAVYKAPIKVGAEVSVNHVVLMKNFTSKTLKRTFPTIYLGMLKPATGAAAPTAVVQAGGGPDPRVAKAHGANAYTIAQVIAQRNKLRGKTVVIRGRVVKYNPEIMGRNWVHLRDGSAAGGPQSDEILVTTTSATKVGAIVTARGSVRTNADFGAGYAYPVLVEHATLQP